MSNEKENMKEMPTWQEFQNELIVRAMKNESFRKELMNDPKAVLEREMGKREEGLKLPAGLEVKIIEQPDNALYIVLPFCHDSTVSDEELDLVAGGHFLPPPVTREELEKLGSPLFPLR